MSDTGGARLDARLARLTAERDAAIERAERAERENARRINDAVQRRSAADARAIALLGSTWQEALAVIEIAASPRQAGLRQAVDAWRAAVREHTRARNE